MSETTTTSQRPIKVAVAVAVAAVLVVAGVAGYEAVNTMHTDRTRAAVSSWRHAADGLIVRHRAAANELTGAQQQLAHARSLAEEARGTVADDSTVQALESAISSTEAVTATSKRVIGARTPAPVMPTPDFWGGGLSTSVTTINATTFTSTRKDLRRALTALSDAQAAVVASRDTKRLADAKSIVAEAQNVLEASIGKTSDTTATDALTSAISDESAAIDAAEKGTRPASTLAEKSAVTAAAQKRVAVAVVAWRTRQATARAVSSTPAAAMPATRSATPTAPTTPAAPTESNGVDYVENVWTTGYGKESQGLIYTCRGASSGVNVTPWYGLPAIAQDVACGGHGFPQRAGATVRIEGPAAGALAGTYRVVGVVAHLNGETQTTADLPRGYDLLFQTCVTNHLNMAVVGLTRIG